MHTLVAWALLRGVQRFDSIDLRAQAHQLMTDGVSHLVLIPGPACGGRERLARDRPDVPQSGGEGG